MMLYSANSLSLLDFRYSMRCLNSCDFYFCKLESWIKTMLHVIYIFISVTCSLENSWAPHILQTHDHRLWTTDVMWYKKLIRPFVRWTKKFYCKPFFRNYLPITRSWQGFSELLPSFCVPHESSIVINISHFDLTLQN